VSRFAGQEGKAGFALVEMLVAVAVLAVLVALVPRSLVAARALGERSDDWLAASLVAEAVLADALAAPGLRPGTLSGAVDGRQWRAVVAPSLEGIAGAPGGRTLLDIRLEVAVADGSALVVETLRIGAGG
jgi:prepilin-type N-terminal cleavage/methylation domain-containing protein